ncbi:COBRA-like protein-7 precursor [Actinidia rufa]|uniref:COBRA-like protein-7 n=1 Tax=Actinidia rufa TaxID=165716 RepID=A0A7J0FJD3_9ERIC|nr:COBRA-like protein-7 precursor [Actinidia rufa]
MWATGEGQPEPVHRSQWPSFGIYSGCQLAGGLQHHAVQVGETEMLRIVFHFRQRFCCPVQHVLVVAKTTNKIREGLGQEGKIGLAEANALWASLRDFADWFAAVQLEKAMPGFKEVYSFHGSIIPDGANPRKDPRVPGMQQSDIFFTKKATPGIDVARGTVFLRKCTSMGKNAPFLLCFLPAFVVKSVQPPRFAAIL